MFQNSFQNGNYFELYDPKSNFLVIQYPKTNKKTFSKSLTYPIWPIPKYSTNNSKV